MYGTFYKSHLPELRHSLVFRVGDYFKGISREFPGTPRNGTPFWEASHTTPINSWKFMGSLWEPYGKGVPFLGAPGNSLDYFFSDSTFKIEWVGSRNGTVFSKDVSMYTPLKTNMSPFFPGHLGFRGCTALRGRVY